MKQISGRKVQSDEGISKLGPGSISRLIMRRKSEKFDSESPCYHVFNITSLCKRKSNKQVACSCCRKEDNFSNFKDAELERIKLETKYQCNFVIQKGIIGQKYYIFPGDNFITFKDADLYRKPLEKKHKCKFVIQTLISKPKYYIFPDPDDARHEEKFFKYTYVKDSNFDIFKS